MRVRSTNSFPGIAASSASISVIASRSGSLSKFTDRGFRSSVGDLLVDRTTETSGFSFSPVDFRLRAWDAKARLASSTAPQTLSHLSGVTSAFGQRLRNSRPACAAKRGCLNKTLPVRTNWTGVPILASFRAQAAASRAKLRAASARISVASLSLWCQAANTSVASVEISAFSALCAQSIRSFGSFSCRVRRKRRPNSGQTKPWS